MSIPTTKPVNDAAKLGGKEPEYYATANKMSETSSGTITVTEGSLSINMWQRRNGWTRLAVMASGMDVAHNTVIMQIVGTAGLVNTAKFVGVCKIKSNDVMLPCIFDVNEAGQIRARNNAAANMSEVAFDVTLPALNV